MFYKGLSQTLFWVSKLFESNREFGEFNLYLTSSTQIIVMEMSFRHVCGQNSCQNPVIKKDQIYHLINLMKKKNKPSQLISSEVES